MRSSDTGYWRSLEQLAGDPRVQAFIEREFPEHATEPPDGITRRSMLSLLGASLSLAGLTACRRPAEKIVPFVQAPENLVPGIPLHFATTMPLSTSAYGLVVESHENRPTKIEGNELHPSTGGASSAFVQAAILDLYDPDRAGSPQLMQEKKTWADFTAAWKEIEPGLLERQGAGLAVLSEPFCSPTLARLTRSLLERYPRARWVVWEPLSDEAARDGVAAVTGESDRCVYHFERAKVVLALDSDFLLSDPEAIRHAGGFAAARRVAAPDDPMARLWAVESAVSVTGASADHRLRLPARLVSAFVARLAAELQARGIEAGAGSAAELPGIDERTLAALASDLAAHRGESLILAGPGQPPEVHAAVLALNAALDNVGRSVTLERRPDEARSMQSGLVGLVEALRAGEVGTLVILGGNPAYDAPADLDVAGALARAERVIHFSTQRNETSQGATWYLPCAHFLESWGDARAVGGTVSVIQPLIEPLYGGFSPVELLGLLATGEPKPAHERVRETWRLLLGDAGFEKRWERVLHDGVLDPGAAEAQGPAPPISPEARRAAFGRLAARVAALQPPQGVEVVFRPSPSTYDGRFANNGWLQELPDPITKLTWDNAAQMSPATAARLEVQNEDVVRIEIEGRSLEIPVWIVPGQADDSIALELGYGRRAAGRVGTGRGFDTFALRTTRALWVAEGARVEPTGRRHALVGSQDHYILDTLGIGERRDRSGQLVREIDLEEFRAHPTAAAEHEIEHPPLRSMWQEHSYAEGPQWGMSIDLNVCTGCNACVVACQSENNIPIVGKDEVANGREMHWIRIDRYFSGTPEEARPVFQPVPCMQCENAPCEQVCPVAATVHDAEGLNTMVYNRCIGTRYCANNCPYKVRRFNYYNFTKDTPEVQKLAHNPDVTVRSRGVMEKCTYCTQRINAAKIHAKLEGRTLRDGELQTACQQACPTRAIRFGDIRDPQSRVSRAKAEPRDYVMLGELNNKPRTSYLARLRNPHAELGDHEPA